MPTPSLLALCAAAALTTAGPQPAARPPAPLTEPLQTDRPDFTEGTAAVPRGRFQIESGYTFTYNRGDGATTRDHVLPELLLRACLAQDLELRLGWEGYNWTHIGEGGGSFEENGVTDASIGLKVHLLEQSGWRPDLGVLAEASIPLGDGAKSAEQVDGALKLLWAYDLTDRLAVAGNLNFGAVTGQDRDRHLEASASLSLSGDLAEGLGGYAEYFGIYPAERSLADEHYLACGLTFPVGLNLQFDARVGFGLDENSADVFTGAGFAVRW